MALIEGIGDELVMAAFILACLVLFALAWMSTFVHDPPEIADHVTPSGLVSQNLDFPGSIEDDLERIANEIEEEAEAVENEISVLTLQRTAFLQTLTHSGDGESGSGADDDDPPPLADVEEDDDDDDDDDYETIDGDSAESTAADQSTENASYAPPAVDSEEAIPTFEFPCPHDESSSAEPAPSSSSSSSLMAPYRRVDDDSGVGVSSNSSPSTSSPNDDSLHTLSSPSSSASAATTTCVSTPTAAMSTVNQSSSSLVTASDPAGSRPETVLRRRPARNSGSGVVDASGSGGDSPPGTSYESATNGAPVSAGNSDGHMTVRIKFINDVIREMRVKSTDTIRDFKATFFAEELAALNRVRFIFNGQMLSDHLSFGHYNITNNTVIHCLVSRGGNGGGNSAAQDDGNGVGGGAGGGGGDDVIIQELDLSRLVFPLVAVILSCIWYFRVQYRQLFNATSSAALLLLTGIFFFAVFTSLRNRAAVANNNANNNNNDTNVNNNVDGTENANARQNGLAAS